MLKYYVKSKLAVQDLKNQFKKNIEGASLIEYSILIGLISAAVILVVVVIGNRISGAWDTLNNAMNEGGMVDPN